MENNNYYQEVIMSDEEKIQMYQRLEKEELIGMLMESNRLLKLISKELQKHSIEKFIPSMKPIMDSKSCYAPCDKWKIEQGLCTCINNSRFE